MKTKNEFRDEVLKAAEQRPPQWRKGQACFNYLDQYYGIARTVQFKVGIDCFYNDIYIDDFINASYDLLNQAKVI